MFIGHFGIGFGARKLSPRLSLGTLFLACQLADLLWPNLVLLGIETFEIDPGNTVMTPLSFSHYPWSHSLVALTAWGAAFGVLYALLRRPGTKAAVVIAAVVLSHWVLDVLSHRPDVPVTLSDASAIGLGLWNFPAIALPVELGIFGVGVWLYARATSPLDPQGSVGLWALVAFLLVIHAANTFGPPPPSVAAVAWSAQAMWLIVLWGYWIDRHRVAAPTG